MNEYLHKSFAKDALFCGISCQHNPPYSFIFEFQVVFVAGNLNLARVRSHRRKLGSIMAHTWRLLPQLAVDVHQIVSLVPRDRLEFTRVILSIQT